MSSGQGSGTPLEIPVIGGLTQMIVNDMAAETDQWLFENATNLLLWLVSDKIKKLCCRG